MLLILLGTYFSSPENSFLFVYFGFNNSKYGHHYFKINPSFQYPQTRLQFIADAFNPRILNKVNRIQSPGLRSQVT